MYVCGNKERLYVHGSLQRLLFVIKERLTPWDIFSEAFVGAADVTVGVKKSTGALESLTKRTHDVINQTRKEF